MFADTSCGSQSPALSMGPLPADVPFPSGATWLIPGNWTVHERFGRKVAVFMCLLAHSASKMGLIVPPGDFKRLATCRRWRARVPLPSLMMVGPASLATGEKLEDMRSLPGGARTVAGRWVAWLCLASPGVSWPHRAALPSWCLSHLPGQVTAQGRTASVLSAETQPGLVAPSLPRPRLFALPTSAGATA